MELEAEVAEEAYRAMVVSRSGFEMRGGAACNGRKRSGAVQEVGI